MKNLVRFFFALVLLFSCGILYAQDSTVTAPIIGGIFTKIPSWVFPTVLGLYEVLVRVVPTAKNWSILSLVIKAIQFLLPNRASVMQVKNPNTHE